ncbi:hypothetical protein IWW55_000917 [Coemansia sp. RSA 2706]|nr:hypothetical protein IWW55_000917 [Coemansia sp. RSA 2706]KAJ2317801.1 hypothetical protein IWW52_002925 [Coemansia sp. RSA 2704]KAJ2328920.1 hypothetical protein IWW51_000917 [Coemansia sp. RSA 2702]KAJ2365406.1 hypothetical protein H4S01_003262 [Coemansia sp. RSA 2610]KAJ2387319.1 hypothetical protein H4S02_003421 [Coemansia sp. RSA 2611]KAJ2738276.1 hypothetical protein H4R23_001258 [Coemansia sp. Cherry 401B]
MSSAYSTLVSLLKAIGRTSSKLNRIRHSPATIWAIASLSLFIDTFVYTLTVSMLPDILQNTMHSPASANGVVTTMFGVGSVVGSTVSGILSDRLRERRGLQMIGAVVYSVAGIVFYFARHYYQVLLFRLIDGIASGVACTLLYASVGDVYPAKLLAFKVAVVYFCNNVAYTIGPVCGQQLFDMAGVRGPAAVVIALGVLKLVLLFAFTKDSLAIRGQTHESGYIQAVDDGWSLKSPPPPAKSMSLFKLLVRLPVVISTLSIITAIGIQCMLEGLVPLHLVDALNHPHDKGMTFVILGLVFTVMVPAIGKATDKLIEWRGEAMRYYIMLFGSLATICAVVIMALAKSYAVLMVGYAFFAVTDLCMFIPAQSAYGDFVNGENTDSMARGYSIAVFAWAVGAISLPPIGTALYSRYGFLAPTIAIAAVPCALCSVACLLFILRSAHKP